MKKHRDHAAVLAILGQAVADAALDPVRREKLRRAKEKLQRLHRKGRHKPHEVYEVVRLVAEAFWEAYLGAR